MIKNRFKFYIIFFTLRLRSFLFSFFCVFVLLAPSSFTNAQYTEQEIADQLDYYFRHPNEHPHSVMFQQNRDEIESRISGLPNPLAEKKSPCVGAFNLTSEVGTRERKIQLHNTGIDLGCDFSKVSFKIKGTIDGELDELSSDDFDVDEFIKQFSLGVRVSDSIRIDAGLIPSTGGKTSSSSTATDPKGDAGYLVSYTPPRGILSLGYLEGQENPLFNVVRVSFARINSDNKGLNSDEIFNADTTVYSMLAQFFGAHAFVVYKHPDDELIDTKTYTVGVIYQPQWNKNMSFFALRSLSELPKQTGDNNVDVGVGSVSYKITKRHIIALEGAIVKSTFSDEDNIEKSAHYNYLISDSREEPKKIRFTYTDSSETGEAFKIQFNMRVTLLDP